MAPSAAVPIGSIDANRFELRTNLFTGFDYVAWNVRSQCPIRETNLQRGVGRQAIASQIGDRFGARSKTRRIIFDRRLEWMCQHVLIEVVVNSHFKVISLRVLNNVCTNGWWIGISEPYALASGVEVVTVHRCVFIQWTGTPRKGIQRIDSGIGESLIKRTRRLRRPTLARTAHMSSWLLVRPMAMRPP